MCVLQGRHSGGAIFSRGLRQPRLQGLVWPIKERIGQSMGWLIEVKGWEPVHEDEGFGRCGSSTEPANVSCKDCDYSCEASSNPLYSLKHLALSSSSSVFGQALREDLLGFVFLLCFPRAWLSLHLFFCLQ